MKLGYLVPGTNTIPDQITQNRNPYFQALEAADAAQKENKIDLGAMEILLSNLLAAQLYSVIRDATGETQEN